MPDSESIDGIHPLEALWRSGTAKEFYERVRVAVEDAQAALTGTQEIGLMTYLPNGDGLLVESLGYVNPNLLTLYCRDDHDDACTLMVHPTNVTLLLRIVTETIEEPRRALGFRGAVGRR